jgi:hypothetical protein
MGGGGPISNAPGSLIGRADDLAYITAFVGQVAVSSGALLLSGEATLRSGARSQRPPDLSHLIEATPCR